MNSIELSRGHFEDNLIVWSKVTHNPPKNGEKRLDICHERILNSKTFSLDRNKCVLITKKRKKHLVECFPRREFIFRLETSTKKVNKLPFRRRFDEICPAASLRSVTGQNNDKFIEIEKLI